MTGLVHIVDDDASLRRSLVGLLSDSGFETREYSSAENFLQIDQKYEPSCVLLDVTMGGMTGFEMQAQLSKREFSPPVVFLTARASLQQAVSAMRAGACHFLTKPVDDEQLIETMSEAIKQSCPDALFFEFLQKLTRTEKKIAKLVRQDSQTKAIAASLGISERTVEWHRKNIGKKGCCPK
jgi:FixJ family two-component response regulator